MTGTGDAVRVGGARTHACMHAVTQSSMHALSHACMHVQACAEKLDAALPSVGVDAVFVSRCRSACAVQLPPRLQLTSQPFSKPRPDLNLVSRSVVIITAGGGAVQGAATDCLSAWLADGVALLDKAARRTSRAPSPPKKSLCKTRLLLHTPLCLYSHVQNDEPMRSPRLLDGAVPSLRNIRLAVAL